MTSEPPFWPRYDVGFFVRRSAISVALDSIAVREMTLTGA
jgi:hypothetical protein